MMARKTSTAMAAFTTGLISLGFVLAEEPKPIIPPVTATAPIAQPNPPQAAPALPVLPVQAAPALSVMPMRTAPGPFPQAVDKGIQGLATNSKSSEKQVVIEATFLEMRTDFVSEIGLTADRPKNAENSSLLVTCLSSRERKMLAALMRAKPSEVDIISRPQMIMADGQTGYCQVGSSLPMTAIFETNPKDGKAAPDITYATVGLTMRVTPKVSKDSGSVRLTLEPQTSRVVDLDTASENLAVPARAESPDKAHSAQIAGKEGVESNQVTVIESVQLRTSVVLPNGGTVVIGKKVESNTVIETKNLVTGTTVTERGTVSNMMLWIFTVHVIAEKP
jgi:hypothetical protein